MEFPSGTFTFLFTDIESSIRLWEEFPEQMHPVLARHDAIMRRTIEAYNGVVFKTVGDAFCAVFATAPEALSAAIEGQIALHAEAFPDGITLRVRMALHTGTAELRDNDYFGQPLNRVARLLESGYGGQILLSEVAQGLCRDHLLPSASLKSLGEHRLRDLTRPETIFQLVHPDLPSEFPPLKSLNNPALSHNLPQQLTSFIGREKEQNDVKSLLASTRLLTLTGAGGSGKTRLSLQAAVEVLEAYPDGVYLIELAPLSDPALVLQTVALVLGVKEQAGQPLEQTLMDFLASKRLLLLLDNAEHLLSACAQLATTLLLSCPQICLLVTSREALGVAGEQTYPVPSLSLPDPQQPATVESVSLYEAVRLFIDRARSVKPDFAVTNDNAPTVAQLCFRLDGIPLALELAAARVRAMSIEQIALRLDDRFRLLTGGSRTALPRQQTLRALVDWSYDLLSEPERLLLCRLSVFVGGWTIEAAEAIVAGEEIEEGDVLDLLLSLVEKNLVVYTEQQGNGRYRLLETLRQYAQDRLIERGGAEQIRQRHLTYFIELAETVRPKLVGAEQAEWMARLEMEHDNLRAALAWCDHAVNGTEIGLQLTAALLTFWDRRGYWNEGLEQYRSALRRPNAAAPTKARADALRGAGMLARYQSDYRTSRQMFEEVLTIREALGDRAGTAQALNNIGAIELRQGNEAEAKALYEQSLSIRRELGDKSGMAASLLNLGTVAQETGQNAEALQYYQESLVLYGEIGDTGNKTILLTNLGNLALGQKQYVQARAFYEESLALARSNEDKFAIALALVNLAPLLCTQGEYAQAQASLAECLVLCQELGEQRLIAYTLEGFARLADAQHEHSRAAMLWAAAEMLRKSLGAPLARDEQEEHRQYLKANEAALGSEIHAQFWAKGHAITTAQAIEYALASPKNAPIPSDR